MKLGVLTSCFQLPLQKTMDLANKLGYQQLEVHCGLDGKGQIDLEKLEELDVVSLKKELQELDLTISSFAFYENMLHTDLTIRKRNQRSLADLIDFAELLDVSIVSTFIGKDLNASITENFQLMEEGIQPIVSYAEEKGIKIAIENCPMPTWSESGYPATISYSPEFWTEMFRRIPNKNFGLNFDPSHLLWLQIDYLATLSQFKERIFNVHIKDIRTQKDNLAQYGIFGKQIEREHSFDYGWYEPKLAGRGEINWKEFISTLQRNNYQGSYTIELKDNDYKTTEEIVEGLKITKDYVTNLFYQSNESGNIIWI